MNMMMFPRMLTSQDDGWEWLMRVHPSVVRMSAFYVLPFSLLPPAMLLYATYSYGYGDAMLSNMSMGEAWRLAILLLIAELVMVPLMAAVVQRIGDMVGNRPEYHDAYAFAAVAPTPLWLSSLALFVPSQSFNAIVTLMALVLSGRLIYEGAHRLFRLHGHAQASLLTGSILTAGLVAWACLLGLVFAGWGWMVS